MALKLCVIIKVARMPAYVQSVATYVELPYFLVCVFCLEHLVFPFSGFKLVVTWTLSNDLDCQSKNGEN